MLFLYIRIAAGIVALIGATWLVDEIGDRREAKVRAEYAAEIAAANARAEKANEEWRTYYDAEFVKRTGILADLGTLAKSAGNCDKLEPLRVKLNAIHPRTTR